MIVLGIESSCDELAFAILDHDGRSLRANVVHSQIELHAEFGGVVPELASRDHVRQLGPVLSRTLAEASMDLSAIDGIAVTCGPGLIGPLLCGVEFAKGLALASGKPLLASCTTLLASGKTRYLNAFFLLFVFKCFDNL